MITPKLHAAFRWHLQNHFRPYGDNRPRAVIALDKARQDITNGTARHPAQVKPYPAAVRQSQPGRAYIDNPSAAGFRFVGRVQCDNRRGEIWDTREESGWIADAFGDYYKDGTGLCWGEVWQLPGRNGESRFVAGYRFGGGDGGPTLDLSAIYTEPGRWWEPVRRGATGHITGGGYWNWEDNPRSMDAATEAARAADHMANKAAEQEREFQTAWQAGSLWAQEGDAIADFRAELLDLLKQRRAARKDAAFSSNTYTSLCTLIRRRVSQLLRDIHKARQRREKLASGESEPLYFWPGDKRLQDAFCDGAGIDAFPA